MRYMPCRDFERPVAFPIFESSPRSKPWSGFGINMTIAGTRRSLWLLVYNARFSDPNQTWALRGALEKLALIKTGSPVHSLDLSEQLGTGMACNYSESVR